MAATTNIGELVARIIVDTEPAVRNLKAFGQQLKLTENQIGELVTRDQQLKKELAGKLAGAPPTTGVVPPAPVAPELSPQAFDAARVTVEQFAAATGLSAAEVQKLIDSEARLAVQMQLGTNTVAGQQARVNALKSELSMLVVGSEEYRQKLAELHEAQERLRIAQKGGEGALRAFRQEQRLQHFVMRESTEVITGVTFALGMLIGGMQSGKEAAHTLERSLFAGIVAMNGAEFALFSLGRVADKLPGRFGSVAMAVSNMALPISIGIGAIATLSGLLVTLGEKDAKKAEEGVKKFIDVLRTGSVEQQTAAIKRMEEELESLQKRMQEIKPTGTRIEIVRGEKVEFPEFSAEDTARLSVLRRRYEELRDRIQKAREALDEYNTAQREQSRATELLKEGANEYQRIQLQLKQIEELERAGETRLQNGVRIADERRRLEERRRQIMRSTVEEFSDELTVLEQRNKLGEVSLAQLEHHLRRMLDLRDAQGKSVLTARDELMIRTKLNEVLERRRALILETRQLEIETVRDEHERRRREEELRHERAVGELKIKYASDAALFSRALAAENTRHAEALAAIERERIRELEDLRLQSVRNVHERELAAIDTQVKRIREDTEAGRVSQEKAELMLLEAARRRSELEQNYTAELARLRVEAIEDEQARLEARYELERMLIEQSADTQEMKAAKLAKLRAEHERGLQAIQQQRIDRELQAIDRVGDLLHRVFSGAGDELIGKLKRALDMTLEVIRLVKKAESLQAGVDVLDILGFGATILSLFADEGLVVPGRRGEAVPVIAHAGETILPTHKYPLPVALARVQQQLVLGTNAPQRYFDEGGVVGAQLPNLGKLTDKLDEVVNALRQLQAQELRGTVSIDNGKLFLRRHMPDAMKFYRQQTL